MSEVDSRKEFDELVAGSMRFAVAGWKYIELVMPLVFSHSSKTFPAKKILGFVRSYNKAAVRLKKASELYKREIESHNKEYYNASWLHCTFERISRIIGFDQTSKICDCGKDDISLIPAAVRRTFSRALRNLIRKSENLVKLKRSLDDFYQKENERRKAASKAGFQFESALGSFLDKPIPNGFLD